MSTAVRRAWLALACAGCAPEAPSPTEVVLIVTSDLSVPDALDDVRVEAVGPNGKLRTASAELGSAGDLPVSVRLVLGDGDPSPLRVRVRGRLAGADVVERSAMLAFVPGQRRILALPLLARCAGVSCDEGLSCGEEGCADETLDPDALPPYDSATFTALGAAPAAPTVDRGDGADAGTSEPGSDDAGAPAPDDAGEEALDAATDLPDAAGDAGRPSDAGPPRDADAPTDASEADAGCEPVLVCRGLCSPLPLPGLCTCTTDCAKP